MIAEMFPDAKMKDSGMFEHLNFEFDLDSGKITGETAAKDWHGVPIYQYVLDPNQHTATEIITEPTASPSDDSKVEQIVLPTPVTEQPELPPIEGGASALYPD